jgi:serine/threonine protein kinase KIN1/2
MSSAASSASPSIARSSSHTSRRHPTYAPPSADIPHRAQSTTTRPSSSTAGHRSTSSRSHSYDRHPPSNQAAANVARRDYENPNVARPPSSRRSTSREGQYQEPSTQAYRSEPTRATHRSGSRHGQSHSHSRHTTEMSGAATAVANGGSTPVQPSNATTAPSERPAPTSGQPRRRTTITAQTGQWALGKTIGAGSMGKVKLAKNLETGEQVIPPLLP